MSLQRPLYVGIDLGTTNSAAAVFDGERVDLVRTAQGATLTPSVVRIDARGKITVGERARRQLDQDPNNVRAEFKRLMGSAHRLSFAAAGVDKAPEELAAEVLRSIREDIKAQFGMLPARAVISVPALFELPQTAATSEAARLAGFERVELIQEPVASGLGAGFRATEDAGSFLVYDLGGGTFDVSLLEARDGLLRVIGHDGDNFLGGRDFDAAIVEYLSQQLLAETGLRLDRDNPAHSVAWRRLRVAAEEAKIELSRASETEIVIPELSLGGASSELSVSLTREQFERMAEPLIERSIAICRRLLAAHGQSEGMSVGSVILVGGPTAIPLLRTRVAESLGAPFGTGLDPMTLVAEGAAYYAASSGLDAQGTSENSSGSGAKVWLQFPAMSSDLNPFVVGKLVDSADLGKVTQIAVSRADGGWSSEREPLDAQGSFAIMTSLLPRRPNPLLLEGYGPDGEQRVALSPSQFVIVHGITLGDPPLSRSVGVALANNAVRVFFDRGSPLPIRRNFALRTVETLSPADPEGCLRVPIVQGEFPNSHLCRLVGSIEIRATELKAPLATDSLVEVSIELDRGGRLTASATIAGAGVVFEHVAHLLTGRVEPSELQPRLEALTKRLAEMRASAFKHGAQKVVVQLSRADSMVSDCQLAAASARGGDPDACEKAQRLLLDIDALIVEAESELAWPDLDAKARQSMSSAAAWVGAYGTALERQALADAIEALRKASAARNARELNQHLCTIQQLADVAGMREEGAWQGELDFHAGRISLSKDPKQAARWVSEGQRAAKQADQAGLEQAVRALRQLTPLDQAARKRGHSSGVQ